MTGTSSLELMKSSSVLANYLPVVHSLFTLRHSTIQEQVDNHQVFITTLVQVNILLTTAGLVSLHGTLTLINIQMILSMVGTYLLTVFSDCSRL
jgi:UDP-N-acetylglucosamine transferase subunit ALG13